MVSSVFILITRIVFCSTNVLSVAATTSISARHNILSARTPASYTVSFEAVATDELQECLCSAGSRLRGARGIYYPRGPFAADLQCLPLQRVILGWKPHPKPASNPFSGYWWNLKSTHGVKHFGPLNMNNRPGLPVYLVDTYAMPHFMISIWNSHFIELVGKNDHCYFLLIHFQCTSYTCSYSANTYYKRGMQQTLLFQTSRT